jgi:MscS family membrane protein
MFRKALKIFVVAFGVVWIAGNLDMDIGALLAGLGIGGVAIALAGKDTVENLFGAMAIVADRPFQVGDWIRMGKIEGTVEEVGFRSTRVRTFYNSLISFPNAMLIRHEVDNLGVREWRRIKTVIGVSYDTPPTKLEAFIEGIREVIRRHPYTRKDYYHVYFTGFGESSLEILLYLFVKTPDWGTELREKHRFFLDILRLAGELGVEFAFPTRTLHMIESNLPDHGEPPASVREAQRSARSKAREIVDEFTGTGIPPPVVISERPDDAAEGSGES